MSAIAWVYTEIFDRAENSLILAIYPALIICLACERYPRLAVGAFAVGFLLTVLYFLLIRGEAFYVERFFYALCFESLLLRARHSSKSSPGSRAPNCWKK